MAKNKLGLFSIILLGVNAIVGSGIFLLPNKAYALVGVNSLWIIIFDTFLVLSIALCFAEVGSMFKRNGGPYIYAKEAFGDFIGFEVGFMKWVISVIAWAAMAAAFVQALSKVAPIVEQPNIKAAIIVGLLGVLAVINIIGVSVSKLANNIMTIGKLLPLVLFVVVGVFFLDFHNFTVEPAALAKSNGEIMFAEACLLMFYAFTGFESIAVVAEDMDNPKKNIPIAIISVMLFVSVFYILILIVSIGVLGESLASSVAPIADAANSFLGPVGSYIVIIGTLVSIGGINIASSIFTPRSAVVLAEDGILPSFMAKKGRFGTPTYAILSSAVLAGLLALSGSFATLAAISVISRFVQYLPTCLAVPVLRRKRPELKATFRVPFGWIIPAFAIIVSCWLVTNTTLYKIEMGLGGLLVGIPIFFIMRKINGKVKEIPSA